jgi:hypothetical protein
VRFWFRLLALLLPAVAHTSILTAQAQPRAFDFRGHRMGDTLWAVFGSCVGVGQAVTRCEEQTSIGGTKVRARYGFLEGGFSSMALTFRPEHYPAMVAALTEKFGPPDTTWHEPVHNAMGAEYVNEIVAWQTDGGLLQARKYGDRLDVSSIGIMTPKAEAWAKAAADSAAKRAKKDL